MCVHCTDLESEVEQVLHELYKENRIKHLCIGCKSVQWCMWFVSINVLSAVSISREVFTVCLPCLVRYLPREEEEGVESNGLWYEQWFSLVNHDIHKHGLLLNLLEESKS